MIRDDLKINLLNNLLKYMKNTEAENKIEKYIDDLIKEENTNSDDLMDKLIEFFNENVPNEVKAQLYEDISQIIDK